MDNANLKAVVKKLERDILTLEVDYAVSGNVELPRSNSMPLKNRRQPVPVDKTKRHVLNPFLKAQIKLEVDPNN
jgi:hypothetical protein